MVAEDLGSRIEAYLFKSKIKHKEFARQLGIKPSLLSAWIHGRSNVTPDKVETIEKMIDEFERRGGVPVSLIEEKRSSSHLLQAISDSDSPVMALISASAVFCEVAALYAANPEGQFQTAYARAYTRLNQAIADARATLAPEDKSKELLLRSEISRLIYE